MAELDALGPDEGVTNEVMPADSAEHAVVETLRAWAGTVVDIRLLLQRARENEAERADLRSQAATLSDACQSQRQALDGAIGNYLTRVSELRGVRPGWDKPIGWGSPQ